MEKIKTNVGSKLYWLNVFKTLDPLNLKLDQEIANEINNLEWEEYFKEQKEAAVKRGILTQEEADYMYNKDFNAREYLEHKYKFFPRPISINCIDTIDPKFKKHG